MDSIKPITTDAVRTLLAEHVLPGAKRLRSLRMPDDEGLAYLVHCLNHWSRQATYAREVIAPSEQIIGRAVGHLDDAEAALRQLHKMFPDGGYDLMANAVRTAAWSPKMTPRWGAWITSSWKTYTTAWSGEFEIAMAPNNAGAVPFGLGHTGPLPRYIAAVARLVTHESPAVQTVSSHLQVVRSLTAAGYYGGPEISVPPQ